ncbi:MAG: TraU family protein [Syntrophus sp. (in: bacteria)]
MSVLRKKRYSALILALFLALMLAGSFPAHAQSTAAKCENKFPDMVGDVCWRCMFPIRLGGNKIIDFGNMFDSVSTQNSDDFNPGSVFCTCKDTSTGFDRPGAYLSFWEPSRVIEVTTKPYCYPFLFGMDMGDKLNAYGTYGTTASSSESTHKAFYNVHYYTFPLLTIMDLVKGASWCTDWMSDIDLMYFSEVDPLWNDDELTVFTHPEAIVFGNPVAQALCAVDCLATTVGFPWNALFWCAGCWGGMYPFTGNTGVTGSNVRTTSLLATRLLARLARLPIPPAIEWDTSSASAKCGGIINPFLKKSQYKMSTIFPIPETEGTCCHMIGASTFTWGEHRNIPATGEYQMYMLWRKRNCCLKLL